MEKTAEAWQKPSRKSLFAEGGTVFLLHGKNKKRPPPEPPCSAGCGYTNNNVC